MISVFVRRELGDGERDEDDLSDGGEGMRMESSVVMVVSDDEESASGE